MSKVHDAAEDARQQIADLRRQVESLMSERVTPALNNATERAESVARQGIDYTRERAEAIGEQVREQPLLALGFAAAVGYLIGRLAR